MSDPMLPVSPDNQPSPPMGSALPSDLESERLGVRELVEELRSSTGEVAEAFRGLTEQTLNRRPAPEEWSAWDIAYHLAQIEVWYIAKLCEAAASGPVDALERFMAVYQAMRSQAVMLAAALPALPAERLDQPGQLTGVPDWTPRQLVERMTAHDHEHAAQVQAASDVLTARDGEPVSSDSL